MAEFEQKRKAMVKLVREYGVPDKSVLDAMLAIPRHLFVPAQFLSEAYANYPLPLPDQQTISQPYTVAIMLQALELKKGDKVLEVGTGSGWCAALIAHITGPKGMIYTTEIVPELITFAQQNIKKLKIKNLKIIKTDGSKGYKPAAPYDAIIVTAACPQIPKPLIHQLKENGIIVAPIGPWFGQKMIKAKKVKGKLIKENLGYFMFVPLKGKYGYE